MAFQRSRYPLGFYIVALVAEDDTACTWEEAAEGGGAGGGGAGGHGEEDSSWLWESVWQGAPLRPRPAAPPRRKHLHYEMKVPLLQER